MNTEQQMGCSECVCQGEAFPASRLSAFSKQILSFFGLVFGAVLLVVVVGEWLGVFEKITDTIPWPVGWMMVVVGGLPVFLSVVRATKKGRITSHTLMTAGVVAALAVGEWATAVVVVFFMRIGEYAEKFTKERARQAIKRLSDLAPQKARILKGDQETEVPVAEVQTGDLVIVRPGEIIPVDGEVISGHATVNQATITGESMPVEAGPGAKVFAATIAQLGSLKIRVRSVGPNTTFGHVIRMVEEAEKHRAEVQNIADRFSAYYLPVVGGIALLTFLIRHDPLSSAAVLVVACSCSFALATPIAMLASIGAAARHGLMIKGGKYLELLAQPDVLLVDKTGTITLGQPEISDVIPMEGYTESEVLLLAASAEKYSEHPLAEAVRTAALKRNLTLVDPEDFEAVPGLGVRAKVNGDSVRVGNRKLLGQSDLPVTDVLEASGKTLLYVSKNNIGIGILAAQDQLRAEIPGALEAIRKVGVSKMELLTGDHERVASSLAAKLGIEYRANLLPQDKIAIVKSYQEQGRRVIMVGDGVNDAPALAQADVGIAMGAMGSDVAVEAAHVALMGEDWMLIPELFQIARRTMRVVQLNIAFTAIYNLVGLLLAATGLLPLIFAAAAQSLPDLGILANSSRLLRQKRKYTRSDVILSPGQICSPGFSA